MSAFDDLRAAQPGLGFAVYAYEPGGKVTLEVHTPAAWDRPASVFSFAGATLYEAIALAFPSPETNEDIFS